MSAEHSMRGLVQDMNNNTIERSVDEEMDKVHPIVENVEDPSALQ